jgi:ATP-dependent Clp protease ATP-binding subunit ClpX
MPKKDGGDEALRCSFCNKSQREVKKLIAGPTVFICDECVDICLDIIAEDRMLEQQQETALPKPVEINEFLDEYVIDQDMAKKKLSVAVYNHYKRIDFVEKARSEVELQKSNILLIGPTGTGKTLLAQTMAKLLSVPFTIADATTLTEAGYVGEDVENIILKLYQASGNDKEKTQRGIVYIDEVDKRRCSRSSRGRCATYRRKAAASTPTRSFCRSTPPTSCLSAAALLSGWRRTSRAVSTRRPLGLGRRSRAPRRNGPVRFWSTPEFVGRLPVIATLGDLDENALVRILKEPKNSLVRQYQTMFELEDVELQFTDDALQRVAAESMKRNVGARGLRIILEELMLDLMYNIPSQQDIKECVITEDVVLNRSQPRPLKKAV